MRPNSPFMFRLDCSSLTQSRSLPSHYVAPSSSSTHSATSGASSPSNSAPNHAEPDTLANVGAIAGGAAAGILALFLVAIGIWYHLRWRRRGKTSPIKNSQEPPTELKDKGASFTSPPGELETPRELAELHGSRNGPGASHELPHSHGISELAGE